MDDYRLPFIPGADAYALAFAAIEQRSVLAHLLMEFNELDALLKTAHQQNGEGR
jgi:hypothetical protein